MDVNKETVNTITGRNILIAFFLSLVAVISHWGVWTNGVSSFGFNTTVVWLCIVYWVFSSNSNSSLSKSWYWLVPILLVILSFSLFENPWLKLISCCVLPWLFAFFNCYSQLENKETYYWNGDFLFELKLRTELPFRSLRKTQDLMFELLFNQLSGSSSNVALRFGKGLLCLIPIAAIVIFLLSSADASFAKVIDDFGIHLLKNLSWVLLAKVSCVVLMTLLLVSSFTTWKTPFIYNGAKTKDLISKPVWDSVVVGVVIVCLLIIYALFLYLQLEHLFVDTLPDNFSQAEHIVKSGFWQLLFLSVLNVILFFIVYKNTNLTTQNLLRVFIIASGLLLISAAWRVALYIYYFGLSYEKFFACYTTLFALLIFVYLVVTSFVLQRRNIFRVIAFTALWFYGVITMVPVEKVILSSNVVLAKLPNSRINLNHLQALSVDVLNDVRLTTGFSTQKLNHLHIHNNDSGSWEGWLQNKSQIDCRRNWYEKNISLLRNCDD